MSNLAQNLKNVNFNPKKRINPDVSDSSESSDDYTLEISSSGSRSS